MIVHKWYINIKCYLQINANCIIRGNDDMIDCISQFNKTPFEKKSGENFPELRCNHEKASLHVYLQSRLFAKKNVLLNKFMYYYC